jgi:hypothetical protein
MYCVCSKITSSRPSAGTWKFRIGSICFSSLWLNAILHHRSHLWRKVQRTNMRLSLVTGSQFWSVSKHVLAKLPSAKIGWYVLGGKTQRESKRHERHRTETTLYLDRRPFFANLSTFYCNRQGVLFIFLVYLNSFFKKIMFMFLKGTLR